MEISFSKPNSVKSRTLKKRKGSSTIKTQIHSKIEKRRRDKMNTYISQLSTMIPTCNFTTHKLDKITVLRMAVQYLKSIRSSPMQFSSEENLKYSFISDMELKRLILQVSEGFLFVVGCENGRILYISQSVMKVLNCNQGELLGRSLYDVIHPSDIDKVKGQISCVDLNPRHKLMGLKSAKELDLDIPSEQLGLHPGNRRSFFFRIKSDVDESELIPVNVNNYNSDQYNIIHCVGYLKCWNSSGSTDNSKEDGEDSSSLTCLIAIGRSLNNFSNAFQAEKPTFFMSKHTVDGKFLFVDHWITLITGFLPQEILGTSIYEYIHSEDLNEFAEAHRLMLQLFSSGNITKNYRFRTKFNAFINVQSEWKSLQNPWKKDVEYFYCKNTVTWNNETKLEKEKVVEESALVQENELFSFPNFTTEKEDQNLISEFNFHNAVCEKNNNEATMEAILKLLESDTNIAD